jgi:hypothetical protein
MTQPFGEPEKQSITRTDCGTYSAWGSRCIENSGHSGPHRSSYGHAWTDESDRRAAAESVKTMGGRTE